MEDGPYCEANISLAKSRNVTHFIEHESSVPHAQQQLSAPLLSQINPALYIYICIYIYIYIIGVLSEFSVKMNFCSRRVLSVQHFSKDLAFSDGNSLDRPDNTLSVTAYFSPPPPPLPLISLSHTTLPSLVM